MTIFKKFKKLFNLLSPTDKPTGKVYTTKLDEMLGDESSIDVTEYFQSQVKNNRLEVINSEGQVILRIPDPEEFPEVWSDVLKMENDEE